MTGMRFGIEVTSNGDTSESDPRSTVTASNFLLFTRFSFSFYRINPIASKSSWLSIASIEISTAKFITTTGKDTRFCTARHIWCYVMSSLSTLNWTGVIDGDPSHFLHLSPSKVLPTKDFLFYSKAAFALHLIQTHRNENENESEKEEKHVTASSASSFSNCGNRR